MNNGLRRRFWVEMAMALATGLLFLLTIAWKDWIELVLNVDPDAHNGAVEWLIVFVSVVLTITTAALARQEWRRRSVVGA